MNIEETTPEELDKKMKEIEFLQDEFDRIFTNKSWFIRMFTEKKAKKLLDLAEEKLNELIF